MKCLKISAIGKVFSCFYNLANVVQRILEQQADDIEEVVFRLYYYV